MHGKCESAAIDDGRIAGEGSAQAVGVAEIAVKSADDEERSVHRTAGIDERVGQQFDMCCLTCSGRISESARGVALGVGEARAGQMDQLADEIAVVVIIQGLTAKIERSARSDQDLIASPMGAQRTNTAHIESAPADGDLPGERRSVISRGVSVIDVREVRGGELEDAGAGLGEPIGSVDDPADVKADRAGGRRRGQVERDPGERGVIEALHSRPSAGRGRGIILEIDRRSFRVGGDLVVGHAGRVDEVHAATEVEQATDPA